MTYRVVGHVVVLVLASASANAFSALHLVNQVGRGWGAGRRGTVGRCVMPLVGLSGQ